jgi:hypothetical protein
MQILRQEKTLQRSFARKVGAAHPGEEESAPVGFRVEGLTLGWGSPGGGEGRAVGGFPRGLPKESRVESAPAAQPDPQAAFDLDLDLEEQNKKSRPHRGRLFLK